MGKLSTSALAAALLLAGAATSALGQSAPRRMIGTLDVAELCAAVDVQTIELEPVHDSVAYQFQNMLFKAAGVQAADDQEAINRKMRAFFNAHMPELLCANGFFTPKNGNILKYAVRNGGGNPLLDDVLANWKPDLDQVDAADGFTVLDFIEQKMDTYKPDKYRRRAFEADYARFRKAGARHRYELAAAGKPLPPVESVASVLGKLETKAGTGDFYSAIRLATIYRSGRILNGPMPPDPAKMRLWLERAAALATASRDVSDSHWLGMFYGELKERDAELRWYTKAVEFGMPPPKSMIPKGWWESNFELGKAYAQGDGVPRDLERAQWHLERARESAWAPGDSAIPISQRWMGYLAELRGDIDKAARWYRTARYAFATKDDPPSLAKGIEPWLAAKGLPKCGINSDGNKDC